MRHSILLPTRQRPTECIASVVSIVTHLGPFDQCEVLLGVDDDDAESVDILRRALPNAIITSAPRVGYTRIHETVNSLATRATGDWLWLWNDDAFVVGEGAIAVPNDDSEILHARKCITTWRDTGHTEVQAPCAAFPMLSRGLYERMGHFSMHPACDTYLFDLTTKSDVRVGISDIEIFHDVMNDVVRSEHDPATDGGKWNALPGPDASIAAEALRR